MLRSAVFVLAVALLAVGVALVPGPARGSSSGASPGYAGNPRSDGTSETCTACHGSFALNSGSGSVRVTAPATAAPGETVRVTVTVDNQTPAASASLPKRQGFQATVRDAATGAMRGTLALPDPANTQVVGPEGDRYVTHTDGGTAQTSWSFDWVVGAAGGPARVYVAANAANGVGTAGDYIYATTADVAVAATGDERRPEPAFGLGVPRPHPVRAGQAARLGLDLDRPGAVAVRLADGVGRTVRVVSSGDRPAGPSALDVETGGLSAGLYFVVVDGPGGRRTQPLAVVR